jgi:hypothetical protein
MRRGIYGLVAVAAVLIAVFVFHVRVGPAGLPRASCGNGDASIGGATLTGLLVSADSAKVADCLVAGADACKSAGIHVSTPLNTAADFVLQVNSGGAPPDCAVTRFTLTSSNSKHSPHVTTTQCRVSAVASASVTISCPGSQPYLITSP